jgi:hypothetical protein
LTIVAAQSPLGDPRWMPVDPASGPRRTAAGAAMEKGLLAVLDRVRALPVLNPPPGVYPRATLTIDTPDPEAPKAPGRGSMMLGFWPPDMTAVRNGRLVSAGELSHLIIYVNSVREEAFDRTYWKDDRGALYPEPRQVGAVQGFPVYEGFGGVEVSGILVVQAEGRSLFTPVTQERFHRFEVASLEKAIADAAPALKAAQEKYGAFVSPDGVAAREKQRLDSLAQYQKTRPRTPEQMASRERDLRRMDLEEEQRLKADATPQTHRLLGPLTDRLNRANAALAALGSDEKAAPACHQPDARVMGPHPVPTGTPGCQRVVSLAAWDNPALPRTAWQLITVERYWLASEAMRAGARGNAALYYRLNKAVTEDLDWKDIAASMLR